MRIFVTLVLVLGMQTACKKKKTETTETMAPSGSAPSGAAVDPGSAAAGSAHHAHHMRVGPELEKFQNELGDKWHEAKGEQRKTDACEKVGNLEPAAAEIAKAAPPAGADATKWTDGGKQLTEAVAAMKTACGGTDLAAFETAFDNVHNSFHSLIGLAGGHYETDGTHTHTM
jgi:hypothetical protein